MGGRQRRPRCAAWRRTRCRMKPGMHCPAPGTAQARCCAPVGPPLCESESGAAQRAPAGRAGAGRRPLCSAQSAGSCSCPSRPASSAPRTASRWAASGPPAWSPPPGHRHHRLVTTAWSPPPPPGHRHRCSSGAPRAAQHAWPEHKRAHKPGPGSWLFCTKRGQARSIAMPEFRWTGPLRPAPISPRRPVRSLASGAGATLPSSPGQSPSALARLTCAVALGPRRCPLACPCQTMRRRRPRPASWRTSSSA